MSAGRDLETSGKVLEGSGRDSDDPGRDSDPSGGQPATKTKPPRPKPLRFVTLGVVAGLAVVGVGWWALRPNTGSPTSSGGKAASSTQVTSPGPPPLPKLKEGKVMPAFDLPSLRGAGSVSSSSLGGRPVVVNFFASWCPDCSRELSAFASVSAAAGRKVAFVGIDTNDTAPKEALRLLRKAGDHYPVGVDAKATIASDYQVEGLPTTFFVNSSGHIVGEVFGAQSKATLLRWVHRLETP